MIDLGLRTVKAGRKTIEMHTLTCHLCGVEVVLVQPQVAAGKRIL